MPLSDETKGEIIEQLAYLGAMLAPGVILWAGWILLKLGLLGVSIRATKTYLDAREKGMSRPESAKKAGVEGAAVGLLEKLFYWFS